MVTAATAKEAASTIEGSLNMTKSAWGNLLTGMADDNANFDVLVQNLVESLGALGENLLPRIKTAIKGIGELFRTLLPKILDEIPEMISSLFPESIQEEVKRIFEGIVEAIKTTDDKSLKWLPKITEGFACILDNSSEIATGITSIGTVLAVFKCASLVVSLVDAFKKERVGTEGLTVAQWLYNAALAPIGGTIGLVVGIIAGLVAGIIYLWNPNEGFRNAVIGAWNAIKAAASSVWGSICSSKSKCSRS